MISHKHKCIFVHIPRTGGSSIEKTLCGQDWGRVEKKTKHLIASTAKKIYAQYWNEYFKFSFVRNPWDRMVSMARYPKYSGVRLKENSINFNRYLKNFPSLEVDPRSESKNDNFKPSKGSVYLNILNKELNFIGKFENLQEDFNTVCDKIGIPRQQLLHENPSRHKHYAKYYDDETRQIVAEKYAKDIEYFGYKFGED